MIKSNVIVMYKFLTGGAYIRPLKKIIPTNREFEMGLKFSKKNILLGLTFGILLTMPSFTGPAIGSRPLTITQEASAAGAFYVNAYSNDGKYTVLHLWTLITDQWGNVVRAGLTPLSYAPLSGVTYTITVQNYGSYVFDHWGSGGTSNNKTYTFNGNNAWFDAYFRTSGSTGSGITLLIPKTGLYVALYMYPSGTGATEWQKVYDAKKAHPSVPVVAAFNPSSGPGWSKDNNIAYWVNRLRSVGVIMIGYTYDNYGSRSLYDINRAADAYRNWYGADGLLLDEMTNKVGYEQHYRDITAYAKSLGMKMTMGNPGTDVPKSYIGTVDVINITEGVGYMPLSWLSDCVLCSPGTGWHYQYDKRNFSYIRYSLSWLDSNFVTQSAQYVGIMYLTNGTDADGRWFHVSPYFGTMMAILDR